VFRCSILHGLLSYQTSMTALRSFRITAIVAYTLHNNTLEGLGKETCRLSVFQSGEMIEFAADCDICECEVFCNRCQYEASHPVKE
jgi:hypothetical protein